MLTTFSPLSIGSLSVTKNNILNLIVAINTFSPLSIGSLSVTSGIQQVFSVDYILFQSPFYRVFECNSIVKVFTSHIVRYAFSPLSIGSLSVTHSNPSHIDGSARCTFSPLSIGSLSVTFHISFQIILPAYHLSVPFLSGL